MNQRQLKKQDKRAAELLVVAYRHCRSEFVLDDKEDGGRLTYEFPCGGYEYEEWDGVPAYEQWMEIRAWEHPPALARAGFDRATGEDIPPDQRPPAMTKREAREWYRMDAPHGYRWRGGRLVPVGPCGEMVRAARRGREE